MPGPRLFLVDAGVRGEQETCPAALPILSLALAQLEQLAHFPQFHETTSKI